MYRVRLSMVVRVTLSKLMDGQKSGEMGFVLFIYYGGGQRVMFFNLVLFHPY